VPGIFSREAFAQEYMSEVTLAVGTDDFGAMSVGIVVSFHGVPDFIVEAWPSAVRVEFVG
jgi:hypothetical protein